MYVKRSSLKKPNAVIWVSGFNDYFYNFGLMEKFKDSDFYAIDVPNFGKSQIEGRIPYYIDNLTEVFESFDIMRKRYEIDKYRKVTWVGTSTGALFILSYLSQNKVKIDRLILVSPFLDFRTNIFGFEWFVENILSNLIPWLPNFNIKPTSGVPNTSTIALKKFYPVDTRFKYEIDIPLYSKMVKFLIDLQSPIQKGKIKFQIPILIIHSDKNIISLVDENFNLKESDEQGR